ncbi:hypothetical protein GUITHDRAFT_122975 [Guillardia theta CCMP2712]|uniref:Uncharacterized protein n=1 Tax=Guillardia theta (strain CCMP2712) TaxID=905079 RepID=L1I3N3_GUITC|nr:hypothetical protein GUITHDRAFT_122975 [Guillardia theta CCMP2712]EKX30811.1 hypothetical protein GUITHDRAFT_122975 [Guillardia theta CCMP2712]|eukprot:XP_005817791.1 hypothetical protein GUITHDRAFT_122975 [Guillardia theta CCMP2712]
MMPGGGQEVLFYFYVLDRAVHVRSYVMMLKMTKLSSVFLHCCLLQYYHNKQENDRQELEGWRTWISSTGWVVRSDGYRADWRECEEGWSEELREGFRGLEECERPGGYRSFEAFVKEGGGESNKTRRLTTGGSSAASASRVGSDSLDERRKHRDEEASEQVMMTSAHERIEHGHGHGHERDDHDKQQATLTPGLTASKRQEKEKRKPEEGEADRLHDEQRKKRRRQIEGEEAQALVKLSLDQGDQPDELKERNPSQCERAQEAQSRPADKAEADSEVGLQQLHELEEASIPESGKAKQGEDSSSSDSGRWTLPPDMRDTLQVLYLSRSQDSDMTAGHGRVSELCLVVSMRTIAREWELAYKQDMLARPDVLRRVAEQIGGGSPRSPLSGLLARETKEACGRRIANVLEAVQVTSSDAVSGRSAASARRSRGRSEGGNAKFSIEEGEEAIFGRLEEFHGGLIERIGLPSIDLWKGLEDEHCHRKDSEEPFTPPNHNEVTTPKREWEAVTDPSMRRQLSQGIRRIRDVEGLMAEERVKEAGLRKEEVVPLLLYTGRG